EVVLAGAVHPDEVVAVGWQEWRRLWVRCRGQAGHGGHASGGDHPCASPFVRDRARGDRLAREVVMARHPALTLGRAGPAGLAGLAGASFVMVGTAVARLRPAVRAVHPDLCSPWLYVPVWAPRRMPPYAAAARREDLRGLPPA